MKYYAIPETRDGCELPTTPEPMLLEEIGAHLAVWLDRFRLQGYYSNCKQERIPLDGISFRIQPEDSHGILAVIPEDYFKGCFFCGEDHPSEQCPINAGAASKQEQAEVRARAADRIYSASEVPRQPLTNKATV